MYVPNGYHIRRENKTKQAKKKKPLAKVIEEN